MATRLSLNDKLTRLGYKCIPVDAEVYYEYRFRVNGIKYEIFIDVDSKIIGFSVLAPSYPDDWFCIKTYNLTYSNAEKLITYYKKLSKIK